MVFPIHLSFTSQDEEHRIQSCWLTGSPPSECRHGVVSNLRDKDLLRRSASGAIPCLEHTMISAVSPVIADPALRNRCIR